MTLWTFLIHFHSSFINLLDCKWSGRGGGRGGGFSIKPALYVLEARGGCLKRGLQIPRILHGDVSKLHQCACGAVHVQNSVISTLHSARLPRLTTNRHTALISLPVSNEPCFHVCLCAHVSEHVCVDNFFPQHISVPVCVCVWESVCVIRTAENSRNIAPVTCCIILGARGDSPGWFISMERCLPVFEEAKIEQYKACQEKKKKSVFPPHTLHSAVGNSC